MEHTSGMVKIQKEWMLATRNNKMSSDWKLSERWNKCIQLIRAAFIKVSVEEQAGYTPVIGM